MKFLFRYRNGTVGHSSQFHSGVLSINYRSDFCTSCILSILIHILHFLSTISVIINEISKLQSSMFVDLKELSILGKQYQPYLSQIRSIQMAMLGVSSQITLLAAQTNNWSLLDEFQNNSGCFLSIITISLFL